MTLTADVFARLKVVDRGQNDFGGPVFSPSMDVLLQLVNGTGADQADLVFLDERTVADGANDDLDLNGVLSDAYGASFDAAELVTLFVVNAPRSGAANSTALIIGGASNAFAGFLGSATDTIGPIRPGGMLMIGCGAADGIGAVTAGTADILRIANGSGAAATYQVALLGRSS